MNFVQPHYQAFGIAANFRPGPFGYLFYAYCFGKFHETNIQAKFGVKENSPTEKNSSARRADTHAADKADIKSAMTDLLPGAVMRAYRL